MNWIPGLDTNLSLNDAPRYLTDDEIKDITSQIQGPPLEMATEELRTWYQRELSQCKLCPSMIPTLQKTIEQQHERAKVKIGTSIGIDDASALGQMMSQMTLKSFHTSGAVKNI